MKMEDSPLKNQADSQPIYSSVVQIVFGGILVCIRIPKRKEEWVLVVFLKKFTDFYGDCLT